ncbi:hypothetical protein ACHAW6_002031 [Cyclotella cf. meneghiniana]
MNTAANVLPNNISSMSSATTAATAASTTPSTALSTPALAPTNDALKFFLANVGFSQTAPQIKSYIEQYFGPVNYVKLIPHRDPTSTSTSTGGGPTTKHRGYGFLYMLTEEGGAALENYANAFPGNKIRLLDREGVYVAKHDESRVSHGLAQGVGDASGVGYATAVTAGSVATGYSAQPGVYDASSTTPYSYEAANVNVNAGGGYAQYYDANALSSQQQPTLDNYTAYYAQQPPAQQHQQQLYSNAPQLNQPLVPAALASTSASQQYSYASVPPSSSSYVNVPTASGIMAPTMVDNPYDRSSVSHHYTAAPAVGAVASTPTYSQPTHQPQVATMGYLQQPQQQQPPTTAYPNTAYPPQPQQLQQTQPPHPTMYQPPMDNYNPPPMDGYNTQQGYTAYNPPPRQIMHGQPPQQQQHQNGRGGYPHPSGGTKHTRNAGRGGARGHTMMPRGTAARMGGPSMGGRGAPPPPPTGGPMNHNTMGIGMGMGGPINNGIAVPPPPPPPPVRGGRGRSGGRMAFHHGARGGGRQGGRNRDLRRDRPY